MGAWGYDMLASDNALDALGELGDVISVKKLYPLNFTKQKIAKVRKALEDNQDTFISRKDEERYDHRDFFEMVGVVSLAVGATISEPVKKTILAEIDAELNDVLKYGWNDSGISRKDVLTDLRAKIETHVPGNIMNIEHKGLFEMIMGE